MTFPFLGFSQVQYTIADVPVCWSVGGTDSSIVKFTIVTTQGAFLDLGYFDPGGNPVTVSGGTLKTGFCVPSDSLSIDSIGRTFTLNVGDQSVSWNDSVGAKKIDDLTDGYYRESGSFPGFWNLFLGLDSVSVNTYANGNIGIGFNSGISIREGAFNIGIGDRSNELTKDSYSNISIGYSANRRNIQGTTNVTIGSYAGGYNKSSDNIFIGENVAYVDTFSTANTFLGAYANSPDAHNLSKFAIGQIKSDSSIVLGYYARTKNKTTAQEIVIGSAIPGNGSHSATLGGNRIDSTFLYGNLNLNGYGSGNKLPGIIGKTGSPYLALFATDGTITEIHRDSVGGGGGFTLPTDSITFNDNSLDAVAGKLQRDDNVGTLVYGSPTGVPLRTGGTLGWYVKNQTGSQIDKGTVVRAAGTVGNSDQILIDKMIADGSIEAKFTLGITAEDIADGADGWVFDHGKIKPLDLSAYNQSTVLYVSTTVPGGLTDTVPVAPDLVLPIGFVVDSTSNGTLAVRLGLQSTVSASNGLTATATADNTETKLGGDLTQFTEIDGSNTYGIRFDSLGSFSAFSRGDTRLRSDSTTWGVISNLWFDDLNGLLLETYSSSSLSNTQLFFPRTGQARFRQQRNYNGTNYDNIFQIHEGTTTISALNVDSSNYTELRFTPEKIFLDANTVGSDGWVVTLIDSTTKEIDYRPINGIEQDTAAAIDFENLPNKIYQFDFTGKSSATVSFTNVKIASVYVIHVLNSNAGDVITWPADCKTETGATLTSTTLAGAGRIFTMYYDGLYYYIK